MTVLRKPLRNQKKRSRLMKKFKNNRTQRRVKRKFPPRLLKGTENYLKIKKHPMIKRQPSKSLPSQESF